MDTIETGKGIVLFDGECNFCDATVQFFIKYDKNDVLRFASQQSVIGNKILEDYEIKELNVSTVIFIFNQNIYSKSDAIIEICKLLSGFPKLFVLMRILPVPLRNFFYDLFARYRYKLFGFKKECVIPSEEIKKKFLDFK